MHIIQIVSKNKLNAFLDGNLWPEVVIFRRFVHFNKRSDNTLFVTDDNNKE